MITPSGSSLLCFCLVRPPYLLSSGWTMSFMPGWSFTSLWIMWKGIPCNWHWAFLQVHWIYWDLRAPSYRGLSWANLLWSHHCVSWSQLTAHHSFPKLHLSLYPTKQTGLPCDHSYSKVYCQLFDIFIVSNQLLSVLNKSLSTLSGQSDIPRYLSKK